jgi:uncharacterized protein
VVIEGPKACGKTMTASQQAAWAPHLCSRARLRKAPKRYFVDPSLALAAVGATAERLLQGFEWFAQLFESLVIRDLRVLSQPLAAEVFHYRDDYGVEVDAIVQLRDGRWGAIEIKLGEGQVDQAATNLKRFSEQIDHQRSGTPTFLAVICGKGDLSCNHHGASACLSALLYPPTSGNPRPNPCALFMPGPSVAAAMLPA